MPEVKLPLRIPEPFQRDCVQWRVRVWATEIRNSALQMVGHLPGQRVRCCFYRLFGMKLAKGVRIGARCRILGGPGRIRIGARSVMNAECVLDGRFPLDIGSDVSISIQSLILTLEHDLQAPDFRAVGAPVCIGDRAFVGARAVVLPGVRIGAGAAVAAGAVVTKDVDPYTVVAGVPAKPVGVRSRDLSYFL